MKQKNIAHYGYNIGMLIIVAALVTTVPNITNPNVYLTSLVVTALVILWWGATWNDFRN